MKRRDFIHTFINLGTTALVVTADPAIKIGRCLADKIPAPDGEILIFKTNPKVSKTLRNGMMILSRPDQSKYLILNENGSWIWDLVKAGKTSYQISRLFSRKFSLPANRVLNDVHTFLSHLKKEGYIDLVQVGKRLAVRKPASRAGTI
ncbi:MAG: PqqD family protein [bacterium]|nr:PqqD family protein [bacterium]